MTAFRENWNSIYGDSFAIRARITGSSLEVAQKWARSYIDYFLGLYVEARCKDEELGFQLAENAELRRQIDLLKKQVDTHQHRVEEQLKALEQKDNLLFNQTTELQAGRERIAELTGENARLRAEYAIPDTE